MDVICANPRNDVNETAIRKVRFGLRRMAWLAPRTHVAVAAEPAPLARCELSVETLAGPKVRVTALDADWRNAIDIAVARAARLVTRAVRRTQGTPPPILPPRRRAA
ncbi:MAG: hypothetical protein U1F41_12740 [Burkholderiales bacterium]